MEDGRVYVQPSFDHTKETFIPNDISVKECWASFKREPRVPPFNKSTYNPGTRFNLAYPAESATTVGNPASLGPTEALTLPCILYICDAGTVVSILQGQDAFDLDPDIPACNEQTPGYDKRVRDVTTQFGGGR